MSKPSINWDHVAPEFKWLVLQKDKKHGWLYECRPYPQKLFWTNERGKVCMADGFASYTPGTCDWKDSLVKRPEEPDNG